MSQLSDFHNMPSSASPSEPNPTSLENKELVPGESSVEAEAGLNSQSWNQITETHAPIPPLPCEIPSLDCPTLVGPYPIKGKIGAGGIGVVLRGYDAEFNRSLAIKLLQYKHKNNPDLASRFLEEAQIMGQLQHPNIPPVHRLGTFSDGRPFFSMKLIKGKTLAQMLKDRRDPSQDLPRFIGIFENTCKALAYAHSRGILHRDLKPENIMVGSLDEMYVMDWGMARVDKGGSPDGGEAEDHSTIVTARTQGQEHLTRAGMGTIGFMPPEQILSGVGRVDARSDVFGLGAILCVILTGKAPYQAANKQELYELAFNGQLCAAGFNRLDRCSADGELVDLAKKCLAHRKEDRPAHAGEVAEAVTRYQAKVQEARRQLELKLAQEQIKKREQRKQRRLMLALVLLGIFTLGMIWLHQEVNRQHQVDIANKDEVISKKDAVITKIESSSKFDAALSRFYGHLNHLDFTLARAELKQAETVAAESKAAEFRDQLLQARKHFNFINDLEVVQSCLAASLIAGENLFTGNFADAHLGGMLQRHGYWKEAESPHEIAERIRVSPIRLHLLMAFDHWTIQTQDLQRRQWLDSIIGLADDNFSLRNSPEYQQSWSEGKKSIAGLQVKIPLPLLINEGIRRLQAGTNSLSGLGGIVESNRDNYWGRLWLGVAYLKARQPKMARKHFEEATLLRRESPVAFNNLGCAFFFQADFDDAQLNFERAAQLLSRTHQLHDVVQKHLQLCQRYPVLEQRLKVYLDKPAPPPDAEEMLELADLCYRCKQMYTLAARFTASALKISPQLAEEARFAHHRLQGARAAVLAATGQGIGANSLKPNECQELRNQALIWLRAWLAAMKGNSPQVRSGPKFNAAQLLKEPDLAPVRSQEALKQLKMDMAESQSWQEFWSEVEVLFQGKNPVQKISS